MRILILLALSSVVLPAQDFQVPERVAKLLDQANQRAGEGDLAGAVPLLEASFVESQREFGEEHPVCAVTLVNLASVLRRQHRLADAREAAVRALNLLEARFGPTDVILAPALNTLAEIHIERGYYNAARALLGRSLAIGPDSGIHYTTTLHNLGGLYRLLGDEEEARRYYRRAYELRTSLLGRDHPYTLLSADALAKRAGKKTAGHAFR
jgi:tetratricopeptide (TPR) repeat protein